MWSIISISTNTGAGLGGSLPDAESVPGRCGCSGPHQACTILLKLLQAHGLKVIRTFKCFSGLWPNCLVLCRAENLYQSLWTLKYKASNFNYNIIIIERDIMILFFHACEFSIIIVQFPDNSILICFHGELRLEKITEWNGQF